MRWSWTVVALAAVVTAAAQEDALTAKSHAARQALAAGHYTEAVKIYRELVAALPDNPGLRFNLGLALDQGGQAAEAIPELEKATRAQPEFAPAWFLLGLAFQQLGKPKEAIAPLRKAVSLNGQDSRARLELADAELAGGQPRDAAGDFAALAKSHPDMAKAWQGLGLSYVALGERAYARLADTALRSGYMYALAGHAREAEGRYAESLALYQEAIREAPGLPGLHAARAAIYRQTNHADWAAIEEARESDVHKPDCAAHNAACAFLAGEWLRSLAEAEKRATPENLYWASRASGALAEQAFQRIAGLPPSAEIHELLAESDQRTGRRLEAIEEWRKALAMAPDDRRLQGRLAESLIRGRKYEDAEKLLRPLVEGQPENGEWRYLLGEALFEQRREDAALPHLLAADRLMPGHLPTSEVLGRVYLAIGQPAKAIDRLERARPLDDGAISFALSAAYRRLGRETEARAALARFEQLTQQKGPAPAVPDAIPAP